MNDLLSAINRLFARLGPKLALALLVLLALTLLAGIYLGRQSAYRTVTLGPQNLDRLQGELSSARESLRAAQGEVQIQRTRHDVDSHALELLRSEMAAEKERTAELEEGMRSYRNMVVADDTPNGLSLRKPELVAGETPGRFTYRIFIQQKEREFEMVEGTVSVEVFGMKDQTEVRYPLAALSKDFDDKTAKLHFRYFQAIEGELALPEGFEPRGMTVVARASKPRDSEVREQFPWVLQERLINVGK
jgi:hypothetical protein